MSGAFDFSNCGPHKWPIVDWFHFAFYYAFEYSREQSGRQHLYSTKDACVALDTLLLPPQNVVGEMLQAGTQAYMQAQKLPAETLPWLFAFFLSKMQLAKLKFTLTR